MQRHLDVAQNCIALQQGIGEELTILTPLRDVEEVLCKFVKSIATVETFNNRDNFINIWNETHFPGESEMSIRRFIRLGWTTEDYIGWDWAGDNDRNVKYVLEFVHLDSRRLGYYWDEAWEYVRAMLIMDALVDWIYDMLKSGKKRHEYERV
jgi:hypothetical protein